MLDYEFFYLISIPIYLIFVIILFLKKYNYLKIFLISIFYFYIISLLSVTLFPIPFQGLDEIGNNFIQKNNFIPFNTIYYIASNEYLNYYVKIKQLLGNIIIFIPMGFFIKLLFINKNFNKNYIYIGIFLSLLIEILQFLIGIILGINYRSVDIDDVILNSFGFLIGYLLFKLTFKETKKEA